MPRRVISEQEAKILQARSAPAERPSSHAPAQGGLLFGGPATPPESPKRASRPSDESSTPETKADGDTYASAILQYVPMETVAAFTFLNGLFLTPGIVPAWLEWTAFAILLVGTFLYAYKSMRHPGLRPAWIQMTFYTIAFAAWAMTVGGPFKHIEGFQPIFGTVFAALVVFLGPLLPPSFPNKTDLPGKDGADAEGA